MAHKSPQSTQVLPSTKTRREPVLSEDEDSYVDDEASSTEEEVYHFGQQAPDSPEEPFIPTAETILWHLKKLQKQRDCSRPAHQFSLQVQKLMTRCTEEWGIPKAVDPLASKTLGIDEAVAEEWIRNRWIDQGIWRPEWKDRPDPSSRWQHEGTEPQSMFIANGAPGCGPRMKNETAKQRAERLQRMLKADASRPIHQFLHQVTVEREISQYLRETRCLADKEYMIQGGIWFDIMHLDNPYENTYALNTVKENWMAWEIWGSNWGTLPGMTWPHEISLENYAKEMLWHIDPDLSHQIYTYLKTKKRGSTLDEASLMAELEKAVLIAAPETAPETTAAKKTAAKKTAVPKAEPAPAKTTKKPVKEKVEKKPAKVTKVTKTTKTTKTAKAKTKTKAAPAAKPKTAAPEPKTRRVSSRLAKRSAPTSEDEEWEEEPKPKRARRQVK